MPETPAVGQGLQVGPLRLDWGTAWADLECSTCSATWVGPIHEDCYWCIVRVRDLQLAQAAVLILGPEVSPYASLDEVRRLARNWQSRLAPAITAGLLTQVQAERAQHRWLRMLGSESHG